MSERRAGDRARRLVGAARRAARARRRTSGRRTADRSAARPRQPARDRARRLLRQVERVGERRPAEHRLGIIGVCPAGRASNAGHRDRRRDEQVVALHELAHHASRARRAAGCSRCTSSAAAAARRARPRRAKSGSVDLLLRRRQAVPERPGAGEPQPGRDLERIVEARVDRLDVRAERFELLRRRGDGGGDFRMRRLA